MQLGETLAVSIHLAFLDAGLHTSLKLEEQREHPKNHLREIGSFPQNGWNYHVDVNPCKHDDVTCEEKKLNRLNDIIRPFSKTCFRPPLKMIMNPQVNPNAHFLHLHSCQHISATSFPPLWRAKYHEEWANLTLLPWQWWQMYHFQKHHLRINTPRKINECHLKRDHSKGNYNFYIFHVSFQWGKFFFYKPIVLCNISAFEGPCIHNLSPKKHISKNGPKNEVPFGFPVLGFPTPPHFPHSQVRETPRYLTCHTSGQKCERGRRHDLHYHDTSLVQKWKHFDSIRAEVSEGFSWWWCLVWAPLIGE